MTDIPRPLFIGGALRAATSGETFATHNPYSGEVLAHVQVASAEDVDAAVTAAAQGQRVWAAMSGAERGRVLMRAALGIRARRDEIARLESLDGGKPIQETPEADVDSGADCLEYFASLAPTIGGECQALGEGGDAPWFYTRREPLGVVGGIGAWNYPFQIACWKAAPALAAGNAMVFKPAEQTPLSVYILAEVLSEAGLPDGVFNVVQGGARVGRMLTAHPGIAKISFTGEVGTGKAVMADSAATLKTVTLELGGKSPLLIFEDADLDDAVSAAILANFYTQGQICTNGTRVFVHADVMDDVLARLVARAEAITLGDPLDPATQMGPLISPEHHASVLAHIKRAKADGATLVTGGGAPDDPALAGKPFVRPTVFRTEDDGLALCRQEIFGPVMTVLPFRDEDEVLARANSLPVGLAGGVMTRDMTRAHRVAARLEAGVVWINTYNITPVEMPFGGVKQSGLGRENGRAALEHVTRIKSVYVEPGHVEAPY
ncbi:betaine-aldehyde dehydrogenase [Roseospira marina]|uniref:Betaine-aldehyde dehydrogenase n=1 Tax=Roseospira marina TaxID=140057 RepID=A0A5M6IBV9_9PROT|nr:betaine-aldehyde dehydrogenase [Roseospira marina]KAA5605780.1 betaine-aldehyde dehydrogenase [Roseospira marina]MBB4313591.1 betaine-aldehyde dehydrogenase [Roseospira marina]MBB5086753.1 betaine-aldehyde dehydrogenase [Roseospira marina]